MIKKPPLSPEQDYAANPTENIWVQANAGTGKTSVLIQRLLRILFRTDDSGANGILCLTYTNAGAGEMRNRILSALRDWATASDKELQELLKDVGTNKKLQKQFQSQKINAALENAEKKVSYENKDSENFLEDSKNDKKTLWQEIKDWSKDTYEDVFEKYMSLRADRLYFSPQAKDIVGALNKKTKPTDGLDGILKAAGDAKSDLQKKSMSATKYFDWMTKTLEEIKKTKPKAFEGALRNGRQLNAVVEELIRRAVRDSENGDKHAIEAARAALEVISVSKYGLTTSKIMDSLKKEWENFSFLSDSELSWNKNEYTRMLTQAMDKSLVFVMKGIGYGATALINTINKTGSKFNGNRRGLSDASKKWEEDNEERKNAMIRKRDEDNLSDNLEIVDQQDVINGTGITDLDAEKQILKRILHP